MNNLKNNKGDNMILRLVEKCEEYIDFVILDKRTEKVVGTFEIMEFPEHYTIGCRANKDFNEYCYDKLDDRLEIFFKEVGSAIEAGLFGLDLDKPVYLLADEKIASRYAIVNCLQRIPRFSGYYFL
jgi:hypothetical protein